MVEVVVTDEFRQWYEALDEETSDDVHKIVELLAEKGVALPFPYSSDLKGSKYGLRELRIQSKGQPLRAAYRFDAQRQAVVLLGANKANDKNFYEWFIAEADGLWEIYVKEVQP